MPSLFEGEKGARKQNIYVSPRSFELETHTQNIWVTIGGFEPADREHISGGLRDFWVAVQKEHDILEGIFELSNAELTEREEEETKNSASA